MSITIDDKAIDGIVARQAKLNELNEPQLDAVREAIKDSIQMGIGVGEVDGALKTVEIYNSITQKLVLARTFTASMTAIVLTYPFINLSKNIIVVILATSIANTLAFYSIDLVAKGLRNINLKLKKKIDEREGSSTNNESGKT